MSRQVGTIELSHAAIAAWPFARTVDDVRELAPVAGHYLTYAPGVEGTPGHFTVARLDIGAGRLRVWYWPGAHGGPGTDRDMTEWRIGPRLAISPA